MVVDTVEIKMKVGLSLWGAIKLRIAGLHALQKSLEAEEVSKDYFTKRNRSVIK